MASPNDKKLTGGQDLAPAAKPKEPKVSAKPKDMNSSMATLPVSDALEKSDKKSKKRRGEETIWNAGADSCGDCDRQRQSGTTKVNGCHRVEPLWPGREPGVPPRSQFYNSSNLLRAMTIGAAYAPADDMENYFNANADMLREQEERRMEMAAAPDTGQDWPNGDLEDQGFDVYDGWIANESKNQADEGVGMLVSEEQDFAGLHNTPKTYLSQEYLGATDITYTRCDSNDSLYNHCEDEMYQTNVGNSMEDFGDFIETDMPKNPYGSSDSNSSRSRTPSDDDLPTLAQEPSNCVTGAGDIQGPLSLDWNMQFNIEHAKRPPTLLVSGRPSALSSESSNNKPRTGSDTDYGFYTPTSCASGSSLRTQSVQSPQLSDYSATCGLTSAESSAFASPDTEQEALPSSNHSNMSCVRPRNTSQRIAPLPKTNTSIDNGARYGTLPEVTRNPPSVRPRPHSDGHAYARPRSGELEMDNLDTASAKSPKDKQIDVKVFNGESERCCDSLDRHHSRKRQGSNQSSLNQHSHSSLPHLPAKPPTANRIDSLLCCSHHNNLNPAPHTSRDDRISQSSDQFNVSRQTSTSDFDQDENSFQEVVDLGPGLRCSPCPICGDDGDDMAFHQESNSHQAQCNCPAGETRSYSQRSLSERRRIQQNLLSEISSQNKPPQAEGDSLHSLLQGMQVTCMEISPEDSKLPDMDDIPLPPQTPILNRQWLKKAAKYLDYNFLYKNFFKDYQSDSDSDDEDLPTGGAVGELDLAIEATPSDLASDPAHTHSRKMLYSVLLKDALLKHLQERSDQYQSSEPDNQDIRKVMLWTEYQAYVLQVSQIGTSACGATAVINVLKYFDLYIEQDKVCEVIKTNLRAETASIGEYLLSRSTAETANKFQIPVTEVVWIYEYFELGVDEGTTAAELMAGVHNLSAGAIYGCFFPMFPERDINIRKWLGEWIEKGAVPVVTLNRQRAMPPGWVVPDAWHHQMVYGVGPKGVYLTNPLEIVPEYVIQNQLCSGSVLLVRRNDVVSRWQKNCNLGLLLQQDDVRWQEMNVLGQVVNILREDQAPRLGTQCPQLTSHIMVPAWYKSGVTLFVRVDTEVHRELLSMSSELAIRSSDQPETMSSTGTSMQQLFAEAPSGAGETMGVTGNPITETYNSPGS